MKEGLEARFAQNARDCVGVESLDPNVPIADLQTMSRSLAGAFGFLIFRVGAIQAALLGILGLALAVIGVYGVVSYGAAQRTREIGIRMALGADRRNILGLVLRSALVQLGIGLAIGIPVALASGLVLASQLYGVKSYDPSILTLAAVILTACALLAASVPARHATKVDPLIALRYE